MGRLMWVDSSLVLIATNVQVFKLILNLLLLLITQDFVNKLFCVFLCNVNCKASIL